MRTLRLDRQFDVVLVHDAIMYATEPGDVLATLRTAASPLPPWWHGRGTAGLCPGNVHARDRGWRRGRRGWAGLRYIEWSWDPDPTDHTYVVDYAFLLREADGSVSVFHDRHVEGLFARAEWLSWFPDAGLQVRSAIDPWNRDVFIATPSRMHHE